MKHNCLIAQSGGPTSAINASLAGIYSAADKSTAVGKIYGGINGIEGIIKGKIVDLKPIMGEFGNLALLKTTPSSFLGSCRYKLKGIDEGREDFKRIFDVFEEYGIKYFFYIGGNDSMDTIAKLQQYQEENPHGVILVGVPKTIDNDLMCVDHTPGFGSAAKYIATTIKEIAYDTAVYDMESIVVAEIMGRNAGWLTLSAGLAEDCTGEPMADLIYIPENPFDYDKLIADIKKTQKLKKQIVIAVSEGIRFENGKLVSESDAKDVFGHGQLGGAAKVVSGYIKEKLNVKVRAVEINVLQRCAAHCLSLTDINESFLIGEKALQTAVEGVSGVMITSTRKDSDMYSLELSYSDIKMIANKEKTVPAEYMNRDKNNISAEGVKYLRPLILGEVNIPHKNGIPIYLSLKKFM
ncbi:6-phosphofructokinase [Lachnospiraceae bacterium NSJ-143]|nr:6-phosphofructokinase [Lachnospiraceae bacterium NSJ-143]